MTLAVLCIGGPLDGETVFFNSPEEIPKTYVYAERRTPEICNSDKIPALVYHRHRYTRRTIDRILILEHESIANGELLQRLIDNYRPAKP